MPEILKALEAVTEPDERWASFAFVNRETGAVRRFALQDFHARADRLILHPGVPESIQDHFLTARHLALYSWFVYRFAPVAQMQALASLEFALNERFPTAGNARPASLPSLFDRAMSEGLLDAKRFSEFSPAGDSPEERDRREKAFLQWLRNYCRFFRNNLAHGASTLMPDCFRTLQLVADAINQLFDVPATNRAA